MESINFHLISFNALKLNDWVDLNGMEAKAQQPPIHFINSNQQHQIKLNFFNLIGGWWIDGEWWVAERPQLLRNCFAASPIRFLPFFHSSFQKEKSRSSWRSFVVHELVGVFDWVRSLWRSHWRCSAHNPPQLTNPPQPHHSQHQPSLFVHSSLLNTAGAAKLFNSNQSSIFLPIRKRRKMRLIELSEQRQINFIYSFQQFLQFFQQLS